MLPRRARWRDTRWGCPSPADARVLAILGPTAVGKSAVAHALARELGGEIVVADPFQRYRGLEVAADSPRTQDRDEVAYHLVGDLGLHESSSAGSYCRAAHAAIDDILARRRVPIVSGGTGLYVRAALADLDFPPEPSEVDRDAAQRLTDDDLAAAVERLRELDAASAARVDQHNPRRVARALALAMSGIAPPTSERLWTATTRHPTLLIGLMRDPQQLTSLIAARVLREIADGLVAEVEAAIDAPGGMSREAAQIIGVAEVRAMRAGSLDPAELPQRLTARTRRLARAQLTWLKKTAGIHTIDTGHATAQVVAAQIAALWRERAIPSVVPVR